MSVKEQLTELLQNEILILDGAMGTAIQGFKLTEEDFRGEIFKDHPKSLKGNNDLLNLTRPDVIRQIYYNYLDAGSDIIETNTFNSTSISQSDYDTEKYVYEINKASAQLAKNTCKEFEEEQEKKHNIRRRKFVAGSMGPTNRTASVSPSVSDPGHRNISKTQFLSVVILSL